MKKKLLVTLGALAVIATAVIAKPMECDKEKCNCDGDVCYCPPDACTPTGEE